MNLKTKGVMRGAGELGVIALALLVDEITELRNGFNTENVRLELRIAIDRGKDMHGGVGHTRANNSGCVARIAGTEIDHIRGALSTLTLRYTILRSQCFLSSTSMRVGDGVTMIRSEDIMSDALAAEVKVG